MTMKTLPKTLALGAAAGCLLLGGVAQAQTEPSVGELPNINGTVACFYECKDGYQNDWWQEVTTLMIMNPGDTNPTLQGVQLYFLDGNSNFIAQLELGTPSFDIDELNVCRTLQAGGVTVPSAGMILTSPSIPTAAFLDYMYMKNLVGKFFKTVDEPFAGRVTGIAKTQCRVVPADVVVSSVIEDAAENAPFVEPILIENTADPTPP